jgi:hypothetical protein
MLSNSSIKAAIERAEAAGVPLAMADARVHATELARLAGLTLGDIDSVSDSAAGAYGPGYFYGPFGPDRYCGTVTSRKRVRGSDGKIHTRRVKRRRCFFPSRLPVSVTVTFKATKAAQRQRRPSARHEPRHHYLRSRAHHVPVALEVDDQALQVGVVARAHARDRVGLAGHGPCLDDLGVALERPGHLGQLSAGGVEQLDERLGRVAHRGVVDDGGEAAQRAVAAQAIDASLDGRRRQRDDAADVAVRSAAVLDE